MSDDFLLSATHSNIFLLKINKACSDLPTASLLCAQPQGHWKMVFTCNYLTSPSLGWTNSRLPSASRGMPLFLAPGSLPHSMKSNTKTLCYLFSLNSTAPGREKTSHSPTVLCYIIPSRESLSQRVGGWVGVIRKPFFSPFWWYITSSSIWYTFKDLETSPEFRRGEKSNYLVCLLKS